MNNSVRCSHDGAFCHHKCPNIVGECFRAATGSSLSKPWEGYPIPIPIPIRQIDFEEIYRTGVKVDADHILADHARGGSLAVRLCLECNLVYGARGVGLHPVNECKYGAIERVMEL